MAQWQMPKGNNKRVETQLAGGIYTGTNSFDVKDEQSIDEYGWDTDEHFPALSTSRLPLALGTSGGAVTRLLTNYNENYLVRAVGSTLQRWDGSAWVQIDTGFANTDWSAANFDLNGDVLILTNGSDEVKYWDGSALADLSPDAPKGKFITADSLRVFIANSPDDDTQDVIHYCGFQDATDWTSQSNSGSVQYYTPNGGAITAIQAFEGQIWVFKRSAFALIYHTGDAWNAYRLVESSQNVGCLNGKTLVECGKVLFWLGDDDVYMGATGAAQAIGEPIRRYLGRVNAAHIDKCCAFTDGFRYYLNLVIDGATEPNVRLSYDTRYRIWHVATINESYRHGVYFKGKAYAGNAAGQTSTINGAASSGNWLVETKDFDRSEAEKEYYELHHQIYQPTGTTLTVEVSVDQGASWVELETVGEASPQAQNQNRIIALTAVPPSHWIRFRYRGSGVFRHYGMQRYFNIMPTMH